MKKYLLMAAAVIITVSASAQGNPGKKKDAPNVKTSHSVVIQKNEFKFGELKKATVVGERKLMKMGSVKKDPTLRALKPSLMKGIKPVKVTTKSSILNAGAVQPEYKGFGFSVFDEDNVTWKMTSGTLTDGTPCLIDVVPNPFNGIDHIPVTYTISDNKLTVPVQKVAAGSTAEFYICGYDNDDIVFTIGEDGSLSTTESKIYYLAFPVGSGFNSNWTGNLGSGVIIQKPTYTLPGQIIAPVAEIEPNDVLLHLITNASGYSFNNNLIMIPAYSNVAFNNYTTGVTTGFEWNVNELDNDGNVAKSITGTDNNFTFPTLKSTYGPVSLKAINETESSVYSYGNQRKVKENVYMYAGSTINNFKFSDGTLPLASRFNPDCTIYYDRNFATPNYAKNSISTLIMYQGKPSKPLYIEGVDFMVYGLEITDAENFALTCELRKVTRTSTGKISMGDIIAQADITSENVLKGEYRSELNFTNFYITDEDGLSTSADHLFIEDEFAVVIKGWDNGTFNAYALVEGEYNENIGSFTYFTLTGNDDIYSFTGYNTKLPVGFIGAAYGYLYTEDATTYNAPIEGGSTRISVNPMLYSEDGTTNKTRLFVDDNTEVPEWVELSFENETYTDTDNKFDLVVNVKKQDDGAAPRSATIKLWQEGAYLTLNITQEGTTDIDGVTAETQENKNARTYNVAGQEVNKSYKGIVICDGKKRINK